MHIFHVNGPLFQNVISKPIEELKSGLYDNILLNKDYKSLRVETYEQLIQPNWLHPPKATRQLSVSGNTVAMNQKSLHCNCFIPPLKMTKKSFLSQVKYLEMSYFWGMYACWMPNALFKPAVVGYCKSHNKWFTKSSPLSDAIETRDPHSSLSVKYKFVNEMEACKPCHCKTLRSDKGKNVNVMVSICL